jgi:hypothetical protein
MVRCVAVIALGVAATGFARAAPVVCPAELPSPGTGFDQVGGTPAKQFVLDAMRLFDGPPGEEMQKSPAELAPDSAVLKNHDLTSTWIFAGNEKLLLVCSYRGTKTYYRTVIRGLPKTCTMHRDARRTVAACE